MVDCFWKYCHESLVRYILLYIIWRINIKVLRLLAPEVLSSFFCYVLDKAQQVLCKNVGCNAVFKWRMKHHQHMKTYLHQQPNKGYIIKDGQYICGKCFKYIKHQSNIPRHLKTCKQKVKNTSYNCTFCEKIFKFPCCLKEHRAFHAKQTEKKVP